MQNYKEFFKGKKVTVMGLGLLGRGVGDSIFIAECGAELTITDLKHKDKLKESLQKLKKYNLPRNGRGGIKYVLGKHDLKDFKNVDFILKNPGVPADSVYIKEAKRNNIPIEMSASLLVKFLNVPVVGITGTRGKSTVTHLIEHILKSAGKKVLLGGNIRGVSNLQLLKKAKNADVLVLELDSWQLQGFGDAEISPNISVFTNFYPDHLNYYKGDMKKYFADKANIFKYQKKGDTLIVGSQAMSFIKKWGKENNQKIKSKIITPPTQLSKGWQISIPGEHNVYNASLAIEAVRKLGIKDSLIKKAVQIFKGVSGRLEFVKEVRGIKIYNDNSSTTPEATIVALKALGDQVAKSRKIVLIMGGSDKNLDFKYLLKDIKKYVKAMMLIPGNGTDIILKDLKNIKVPICEEKDLKDLVNRAYSLSKRGDTILFSPAFASFGMFKNEYDRGDKFMEIVKQIKV